MNTATAENVTPIKPAARKRKARALAIADAALADIDAMPVPPRPAAKTAPKISRRPGIIEQIRIACSPEHRLATVIGSLLGGIVAFMTFVLVHFELSLTWGGAPDPRGLIVIGGLVFSMRTVVEWGRMALGSTAKAVGFAVLLEGVMTLSSHLWLAAIALVYLAGINAIATGVTLARGAAAVAKRDEPEAP